MPPVDRFTVSLDTELLAAFDAHLSRRGYENRSEAIRDLIRDLLIAPRLADGHAEAAAVLSVVCDRDVASSHDHLRSLLLEFDDTVLGVLTRPIDDRHDIYAVVLRGAPNRVQHVVDRIGAVRGLNFTNATLVPIGAVGAPADS